MNQSNHYIYSTLCTNDCRPWKFYDLAIWIVGYFTRADVMLPARTVKVLVNGLVHESLTVRKVKHLTIIE